MNEVASGSLHVPVLKEEVMEYLRTERGAGRYLDCTLGGAGHTIAILKAHPANCVVALDRDARAVKRAEVLLTSYSGRLELHHCAFSEIEKLSLQGPFDGILADLGVSTDQLREKRGFSFSDKAPLDMRMDERQLLRAADIVNSYAEPELYQVLKQGGVGREARAVAKAILRARPIADSAALAKIVNQTVAGLTRKININPATVVFQAIRMAVNHELDEIKALLAHVPTLIKPGARLAVICFHSLEDKLVTSTMRRWQLGDKAPAGWPGMLEGVERASALGRLLTKRALRPSDREVRVNPAARNAILRVFEFQ